MKILLFCHLGQIQEYAGYVSALKELKPVEARLLTMGSDEYALASRLGAFDSVTDILPGQSELDAAETNLPVAAQALKELESRIGTVFVNRDILTDRFFQGRPRLDIDRNTLPLVWTGSRTRQFMYLVYKRLDEEIDRFDPGFMFVETSFAPTRMAWRLAHAKGIPAGGFMSVRFWPERLYLETGLGYDWHQARTAYREMTERPMTVEELGEVETRLDTILREKTKPAYLKSKHARGAPDLLEMLDPSHLAEGIRLWLGKRALTSTTNPQVLPGKMLSPLAKLSRYRRRQKGKRYLLKHQTPFQAIRAGKYAIYFLHVEPELTVEGMAFDYQNQANTLRNILASLPADMSLVVKEHSPMLGYRPLGVYHELVHMPGLIIADTHADSHDLISHASAVITLTGTVALEALLYGIPAIVLGSIYFDCFSGIYKPSGLVELRNLLSDPEALRGATRQDALRALGSMRRASVSGRPHRIDVALRDIDSESAAAMMSELEKLGRNATARSQ